MPRLGQIQHCICHLLGKRLHQLPSRSFHAGVQQEWIPSTAANLCQQNLHDMRLQPVNIRSSAMLPAQAWLHAHLT